MKQGVYKICVVGLHCTAERQFPTERTAMQHAYTLADAAADAAADVFINVVYDIDGVHTMLYTWPPAPVEAS